MKLTKNTSTILKYFAKINHGITVYPGNVISVSSSNQNLVADYVTEETFDKEFSIYDTNKLLSVLNCFNDPDIEFHDDYLIITEGNQQALYMYTDSDNVQSSREFPPHDITDNPIELTRAELAIMKNASASIGTNTWTFRTGINTVDIVAEMVDNSNNNEFKITKNCTLSPSEDRTFNYAKLSLPPMDYTIHLYEFKALFVNNDIGLRYITTCIDEE